MSEDARLAAYSAVSTSLGPRSDRQLGELVDAAVPIGSGIGGRSALLEVAGKPVFVKRVPLTDLERRPENVRSTANVRAARLLPVRHRRARPAGRVRGVAGARRAHHDDELGARGGVRGVPPDVPLAGAAGHDALPEELADVERAVAYWGGGPRYAAVSRPFGSPRRASRCSWSTSRRTSRVARRQIGAVTRPPTGPAPWWKGAGGRHLLHERRGLLHFDAHFENILTDGRRLYFADYGLAISSRFELSRAETGFFERHRTYDRCYTRTLAGELAGRALYGTRRAGRTLRTGARMRGREAPRWGIRKRPRRSSPATRRSPQ